MAISRPLAVHSDFTFLPPGDINPNTAYRRTNGGFIDYNAYAQIRFPLETAPAFANSQSFGKWRDCSNAECSSASSQKEQVSRCRVNGQPAVFYREGAARAELFSGIGAL